MSRPGKRLALLLAALGVVFQVWLFPPGRARRTGEVSTAENLSSAVGQPVGRNPAPRPEALAAPRSAEPARVPPMPEGIATPVEARLPADRAGPAEAVITPVDFPEAEPSAAARPAARGAARRSRSPASPARARRCTVQMLVTAYCPCRRCCGRYTDGRTACGQRVEANGSRFVAADTRILPFGTRVSVPGYHQGAAVPVLDRGTRIRGMRLDVFFLSHAQAQRWGAKWLPVTVYLDGTGHLAGR